MMGVFVIAEVGQSWVCDDIWKQNYARADLAIKAAADAGADAVKFQWCSNGVAMSAHRKVDDHQAYWRLCWPEAWHTDFALMAKAAGLEYMCSVFLPDDVAKIAPFVKRFKVASLEANDVTLRKAIMRYPKPVFVSSGCLTEPQLNALPWWKVDDARILHCTASYPCKLSEANIRMLERLDGLSDHTGNVNMGGWATIASASIIEVHCRLDDTPQSNPDYPHSHAPRQLAKYIRLIREAEQALGSGVKRIETGEAPLMAHRV